MKITKIAFGATAIYGECQTKAYYEAELEHWEDPDESINHLRTKCAQELSLPDRWHDLKHKFARQVSALETIELKIAEANDRLIKAKEAWDKHEQFLLFHGVDPQRLTIDYFHNCRAIQEIEEAEEIKRMEKAAEYLETYGDHDAGFDDGWDYEDEDCEDDEY